MIETTVLNYLASALVGGPDVYTEVPDQKPKKYVLIEKTDRGSIGLVDGDPDVLYAQIEISSISSVSLYDAADLSRSVSEAMDLIDEGDPSVVLQCDFDTEYNATNTQTKEYEYRAVYDIWYTESDLETEELESDDG